MFHILSFYIMLCQVWNTKNFLKLILVLVCCHKEKNRKQLNWNMWVLVISLVNWWSLKFFVSIILNLIAKVVKPKSHVYKSQSSPNSLKVEFKIEKFRYLNNRMGHPDCIIGSYDMRHIFSFLVFKHHPYEVLWDHHNYMQRNTREQVKSVNFLAYAISPDRSDNFCTTVCW